MGSPARTLENVQERVGTKTNRAASKRSLTHQGSKGGGTTPKLRDGWTHPKRGWHVWHSFSNGWPSGSYVGRIGFYAERFGSKSGTEFRMDGEY